MKPIIPSRSFVKLKALVETETGSNLIKNSTVQKQKTSS